MNWYNEYYNEWKRLDLNFNGILTGFLGSTEQIEIVKNFLQDFKSDNTITVIDPVMGDNGRLYPTYAKELSNKMSCLVPYADILTPNLTEACILTNTEYKADMSEKELYKICKSLCKMGAGAVIISGLERGEFLENFVFEQGKEPQIIKQRKVGSCRAGTGDVFSSIIASDIVNGFDFASNSKISL